MAPIYAGVDTDINTFEKDILAQLKKGRFMINPVRGQSLELYFIDGKPDGMLTAEVFNWTGHVLVTPRTQITEALCRKEAQYTGVYLLFGEQEGEELAYIGEGEDNVRIGSEAMRPARTGGQNQFSSPRRRNSLNKAHITYLESRLVEEAKNVGRITLENGNTPARPSLKEAEQANMEGFLDNLLMILPAIGVDAFKQNKRPKLGADDMREAASSVFELVTKKHGLRARAIIEDGDFIVLEGSLARSHWSNRSAQSSYASLHVELVKSGVLAQGREIHCGLPRTLLLRAQAQQAQWSTVDLQMARLNGRSRAATARLTRIGKLSGWESTPKRGAIRCSNSDPI